MQNFYGSRKVLARVEYIDKIIIPRFFFKLYLSIISMCVLVSQSCLTLCNPMDYRPLDPLSMGIFQARILEWVAIPSPRVESMDKIFIARFLKLYLSIVSI